MEIPKWKILPPKEDQKVIMDNYWEKISLLFPNLNQQDFIKYINEDDQGGMEEVLHPHALGRREGKILYSLVRILKPLNILEIGTYDGTSTNHILKAAYNNKKFDGVEAKITKIDVINHIQKSNVVDYPFNFLQENSRNHLVNNSDYDFIFQDGDHSYQGVAYEIDLFSKMKNLKCVMAHDYHLPVGPGRGIKPAYDQFGKNVFAQNQNFKEKSYDSGFIVNLTYRYYLPF